MPFYRVRVRHEILPSTADTVVEADTQEEAEAIAKADGPDLDYGDELGEYEIVASAETSAYDEGVYDADHWLIYDKKGAHVNPSWIPPQEGEIT